MHQSTAANESKYASDDQHQTKFKFCEMSFKILYASSTGHTEYIAEKLNELIPNSNLQDVDDLEDLEGLQELQDAFWGNMVRPENMSRCPKWVTMACHGLPPDGWK